MFGLDRHPAPPELLENRTYLLGVFVECLLILNLFDGHQYVGHGESVNPSKPPVALEDRSRQLEKARLPGRWARKAVWALMTVHFRTQMFRQRTRAGIAHRQKASGSQSLTRCPNGIETCRFPLQPKPKFPQQDA